MNSAVPEDLGGERADRIVAVMTGVSRTIARAMVEAGDATFDGIAVQPKARIGAGALLEAHMPAAAPGLLPEPLDLEVRYEDEHLVVLDKAPGVVVHPGAGNKTGTLAAGILHRWPQVRGVGDEDRWGIVHRLDRETSGLLVVALEYEALAGLRDAIRRRAIERVYLALVDGVVASATGTIDAPLARDPQRPTRFRVDPDGRVARSHYRRLARWPDRRRTLLEVTLETGRTHQIRVHLASIGHPVVADGVYGRGEPGHRVWLHAAHLRFDHPVTGDPIEVDSPLPDDLQGVLDDLGEPAID